MSKYSDNLNKALKKIEQAQSYIQDIEAAGFKLPDYYKTIPKELEDIKNNPNRQGISDERLNHIRYLFNGNIIKSRAKVDLSENSAYRVDIQATSDEVVSVSPLGKDKLRYNELNKYARALQEDITTVTGGMGVVPNHPSQLNLDNLDKTLEDLNKTLGTNYDLTQLTEINKAINEYNRNVAGTGVPPIDPNTLDAILRYATNVVGKAPAGVSPYREQIEKAWYNDVTSTTLTNFGWSKDEIRSFKDLVDTSVFWKKVHKDNLESDGKKTEIHDFTDHINDVLSKGDSKNINELRRKLRNGMNYKDIDKWLQTL